MDDGNAVRDRMVPQEAGRIRTAAHHAKRLHPGPVGDLIAVELRAHAELGYRTDAGSLVSRITEEILRAPGVPDVEEGPADRAAGLFLRAR